MLNNEKGGGIGYSFRPAQRKKLIRVCYVKNLT